MAIIGGLLIVLGTIGCVWPLMAHANAKDDQGIGAIEIAIVVAGVALMFVGLLLKSR
jgi:hypothetical protein